MFSGSPLTPAPDPHSKGGRASAGRGPSLSLNPQCQNIQSASDLCRITQDGQRVIACPLAFANTTAVAVAVTKPSPLGATFHQVRGAGVCSQIDPLRAKCPTDVEAQHRPRSDRRFREILQIEMSNRARLCPGTGQGQQFALEAVFIFAHFCRRRGRNLRSEVSVPLQCNAYVLISIY